jgi:excisionase family DNA binding protein
LLSISASTVRRMADKGVIRSWRIPGSGFRKIPLSEIERLQSLRKARDQDQGDNSAS